MMDPFGCFSPISIHETSKTPVCTSGVRSDLTAPFKSTFCQKVIVDKEQKFLS